MVHPAGYEMPEESRYDGYLQLENGVGMIRLLQNEFEEGFQKIRPTDGRCPCRLQPERLPMII